MLDAVNRSPLHFWYQYLSPNREERKPTPQQEIGTAVHTLVLEPDTWNKRYVIAPSGIDRRTKAGKETWLKFQEDAGDRVVLKQEDAKMVILMAQCVHDHPAARKLLSAAGEAETTHMWKDATTGVQCKCRPDYLHADGSTIVDLKTTRDASPSGFARSVAEYRYWVQASWYLSGVEQATGKRPEQFVFICVENTAPYATGVYVADAEMIQRGAEQAREDLDLLARCKRDSHWPSYSDRIETISLPGWMTGNKAQPMPMADEIESF